MKKIISLSILTALCGLIVGCGVKGSLYFPAQDNENNTSQTQQ